MKKLLALSILFVFLFIAVPVRALDYYVDATTGNDANDGLTEITAWKTIAKVNGVTWGFFQPNDSILFKRGEVWYETLTIPHNGAAEGQITFGAYGTGEKPVISGADPVSGFWVRDNGIYANEREYITITNITVEKALRSGMEFWSSFYITVEDSIVRWCGGKFEVSEYNPDGAYIGNGIDFIHGSRYTTTRNNEIYEIFDSGLSYQEILDGRYSTNHLAENNLIYNCGMAGIEISNWSQGSTINSVTIRANNIFNIGKGWSGIRGQALTIYISEIGPLRGIVLEKQYIGQAAGFQKWQ